MFSDKASREGDGVTSRSYDVEPYFTEGAMEFLDIRKNEVPFPTEGLNHIHYRIFDEGY
jgi:hypothetical protein